MRHYLSAFSLFLLALPAAPAAQTVEFIVSAGKHDRANEPVCVPLHLDPRTKPSAEVEIKDDRGAVVAAGQLAYPCLATEGISPTPRKDRFDLFFVLPNLKTGRSIALKAVISDKARTDSPDDFAFRGVTSRDEQYTELRRGKRPIWRYMHTPLDESSKEARERTFKVFHHVYDPTGDRFLTNGAGGRFPHHRGLFYGFMKTTYGKNTVDIWHCRGETHQEHVGCEAMSIGPVLGLYNVIINWNGVGKKTFAKEQRELTAYNVPGGTLLDFASKLTPTGDPVKLDGDPQHAGFHFRAANEVNDKTAKQTIYIRPDGADKPGKTRNWEPKGDKSHVNLPWLAMSFVLGGQRYTVAYLDRPDNPKEARFSERDYGRFGSYFVTTVTKEKPLLVRYRVWVQEGQMTTDEVKAKSFAFVEPVEVKVKGGG